jgi:predicted Abi (CAAX) family protease
MIFEHPFFTEGVLPFVLVFVLMFAILQKTKILGEGKTQIDAIVSLVLGLILIVTPGPRDMIVGILPWLAVGVAVILTFMILYGFVAGDLNDEKNVPKGMKITFAVLAGIFVTAVVMIVTGLWDRLTSTFSGSGGSSLLLNILFIAVIVGVVLVALRGGKKKGGSGS